MLGIFMPAHKFSTCRSFDPTHHLSDSSGGNLDPKFWGVKLVFTKMAATDVFLKRGADVEIKDKRGFTPIFWAAESGRVDMMRLS